MAECTQLIVFAKPPVPGLAKTRLSPPLTPEQAAAVHEASLKDVVTKALGTGLDVEIHYAGSDDAGGFFAHAFPTTRSLPQVPGDLGQRLTAAFDHAFGTGADRVLIIGSHSPPCQKKRSMRPPGPVPARSCWVRPQTAAITSSASVRTPGHARGRSSGTSHGPAATS